MIRQGAGCLVRIFQDVKNRAVVRAVWIDAVMECANQKTACVMSSKDELRQIR
ncbi:MAG: hypothetical protein HY747_08805 [Elusimicrobia bacterium]|nr:hypothetical protein [Elusimicrobiota bacterium]